MFVRFDGDNDEASASMNELALRDSEWISPPVRSKSGNAESGAASAEAGLADSLSRLDVTEPISEDSGSHGKQDNGSGFITSVAGEVLKSLHEKTELDNNKVFDLYNFCHDSLSCFLDDPRAFYFFLIRKALM